MASYIYMNIQVSLFTWKNLFGLNNGVSVRVYLSMLTHHY